MDENLIKRAVVAGASYALKYKEKNEKLSDSDIINQVVKDIKKIIKDIKENY
ncbi:MAG: hypothetical protein QXU40_03260 [Candidatus Pacearchaeota archaeon]